MEWSQRIGRRIKLRDLHVLLAVAQSGSMAKAAEHLAISQPDISKVVADLERLLGVRLLDRDRYGAAPTIYGTALLKRGIAAFDELRQGVKDIEYLADPTAGELRIGATDVLVAGLLPAIISRLQRRHPRLKFQVMEAPTIAAFYGDLRDRKVDIVIGRILAPIVDRDLSADILFDEPLVVVAGNGSRWLHRRKIELADLSNERWILPPEGSVGAAIIRETFHACGLQYPHAEVICDSSQMVTALLADDPYVSMRPASMMRIGVKQPFKVLPVRLPALPRPVGVVTLKDRTLSPVARIFIDCARELTKSLIRR